MSSFKEYRKHSRIKNKTICFLPQSPLMLQIGMNIDIQLLTEYQTKNIECI